MAIGRLRYTHKLLIQNNTNDVTVILENIETENITPIQIEDNEKNSIVPPSL